MVTIEVKDDVLKWAVQRTGNEEYIYKKFPKLREWINKESQPTLKHLSMWIPFHFCQHKYCLNIHNHRVKDELNCGNEDDRLREWTNHHFYRWFCIASHQIVAKAPFFRNYCFYKRSNDG